MLEFYNDKIHKARKEHKCELCSDKINIGERYHRQSGMYEGEFFDRCLHMGCNNAISQFCKEEQEEEFSYDGVKDWLAEKYCCDCPEYEDCVLEVTRCEKRKGCFTDAEQDY